MVNIEDASALGTAAVLRQQASGNKSGLKVLWSNLHVLSIALFASFVSLDQANLCFRHLRLLTGSPVHEGWSALWLPAGRPGPSIGHACFSETIPSYCIGFKRQRMADVDSTTWRLGGSAFRRHLVRDIFAQAHHIWRRSLGDLGFLSHSRRPYRGLHVCGTLFDGNWGWNLVRDRVSTRFGGQRLSKFNR